MRPDQKKWCVDQQRLAVRGSARHRFGAHHGASARPWLNDERTVVEAADLIRKQPRDEVARTARWHGDHHLDEAGLGRRGRRVAYEGRGGGPNSEPAGRGESPCSPPPSSAL